MLLLWWWSLDHVPLSFSSHNSKSNIFQKWYNVFITTLCWSFRCHIFTVYAQLAILIHRTFGWGSQRFNIRHSAQRHPKWCARLPSQMYRCPDVSSVPLRWCMMAPGALSFGTRWGGLDFETPRNWCIMQKLIISLYIIAFQYSSSRNSLASATVEIHPDQRTHSFPLAILTESRMANSYNGPEFEKIWSSTVRCLLITTGEPRIWDL